MTEKEFMERMKRANSNVKEGMVAQVIDLLPEDREYAAGVYVGVDIGSGDDVGVITEL